MNQKLEDSRFQDFLSLFPEITLPVTLREDSYEEFSLERPISQEFIEHFFPFSANDTDDDTVEYLPCFSIPQTKGFHAIVFWKAQPLEYTYTIATYTPQGQLISQKNLGGTKIHGNSIIQSVIHIDEDWTIKVAVGAADADHGLFDASQSMTINIELLPDGELIFGISD